MKRLGLIAVFALTLVGSFPVLAQLDAAEMIKAGSSNGIAYMSGGVGLDSRNAMQAKESEYNLMVMLALKDGHYLGGGAITVRDKSGKAVVKFNAVGPWIFIKLAPGDYTVLAKIKDEVRSRKIVIGEKGMKRVLLAWANEPA